MIAMGSVVSSASATGISSALGSRNSQRRTSLISNAAWSSTMRGAMRAARTPMMLRQLWLPHLLRRRRRRCCRRRHHHHRQMASTQQARQYLWLSQQRAWDPWRCRHRRQAVTGRQTTRGAEAQQTCTMRAQLIGSVLSSERGLSVSGAGSQASRASILR